MALGGRWFGFDKHFPGGVRFGSALPADDEGIFDDAFQFPDVSRKVMGHQERQRSRRNAFYGLAIELGVLGNIIIDQQRKVLLAFAQRRYLQMNDADELVQVL